ncbi:hypothetical protein BKA70DRAFT_1554056 [Coprinopsis sp. MPI-PUGE-AT-0042]|nr:hypothetical protein BKA70DRAFT_1554056 [Coprinopsis sp. MPI-PUGE-AT-0042]
MNFQLADGPCPLPTELMTRIFGLVCEGHTVRLSLRSHYPPRRCRRVLSASVVLSQICREWRAIVLDAPSLWSNLFIDGGIAGRLPVDRDFSLLVVGMMEVVKRARTQAIRLVVRPPNLDRHEDVNDIRRGWQAVVDFLFGSNGTPAVNYTHLHLLESAEGLDDIDLGPATHLTLEDQSQSISDWLGKQSTPEKMARWPSKMLWLAHNSGLFEQSPEAFGQITDLAIIISQPIWNMRDFLDTLRRLPQLTCLRLNLGLKSSTELDWRDVDTLTLPNLHTMELQNCESTFVRCLPCVRLPALVHIDWIIARYMRPTTASIEEAIVQNAPELRSIRVCYLQVDLWSHSRHHRPASFNLTSTAEHYRSLEESLLVSQVDPTMFVSNFTVCRRSPRFLIPKVGPSYIDEIQAIPYVGHNWKAQLASSDSEMQARHIKICATDILSVKRILTVLGSAQIPAQHRSLEVVLRYP